jgi:hypothetical protein
MSALRDLPPSPRLPVEHLSAGFGNVTNSYKFYWFLAILDHVRENNTPVVTIDQLVARMVAGVWYPTNYFRLSFGKQDRLSQIALALKSDLDLPIDTGRRAVIDAALACMGQNAPLANEIRSLSVYVPYRFQRPFFAAQLRGVADWQVNRRIQELANHAFADPQSPCLYRYLHEEDGAIEIHPLWFEYLQINLPIVTGYCLWHLTNYLQRNNPNVPNVAGKLFEPEQRNLQSSRRFWRFAFDAMGGVRCIYSGEVVARDAFSLDHFLPWSFVVHDLLWNIVPTPKSVNSAKSDQLPDLGRYFEPFARLQHGAFQAVASLNKESLLEDYVLLFRKQSVAEVQALSFDAFKGVLQETVAPQIQIARNMGFSADWSYRA